MENAEAFLKTIAPMHLKDAPGGAEHLTASAETLRRGKVAFADKCARCHSSKQPPREIATDRVKVEAWFRESVLSPDFLEQELPLRRPPLSGLPARHEHRPRRRHQRHARAGLVGLLVGDLQGAARDRKDQRALQPAGARQAARVGAQGRWPRLLPHADARVDVGDGARICTTTRSGCTSRILRCAAGCSRSTTRPRSCCGPNGGSACSRSS